MVKYQKVSKYYENDCRSNNNILSPTTENILDHQKSKLKFNGSCLVQDEITYIPQTVVNIYIVYEITKKNSIGDYPTRENCLFGSVKLSKNPDIDKYKYSGYSVGFDRKGEFSFANRFGQNVIIFGADMSSSIHSTNKTKNILVLGKDFVQGLDDTTIYAEKLYSINFTKTNTKFCLSLFCNGSKSYLFVNGTKIHKFKTKDSEIIAASICLGNISRDFSVNNMKKTGLNGYVYDFIVDYDPIGNDKILDIHKYLMKKNNIK